MLARQHTLALSQAAQWLAYIMAFSTRSTVTEVCDTMPSVWALTQRVAERCDRECTDACDRGVHTSKQPLDPSDRYSGMSNARGVALGLDGYPNWWQVHQCWLVRV